MENLVATREGPVLIDLELLMQPVSRPTDESHVEHSCLRTGLLSAREVKTLSAMNATAYALPPTRQATAKPTMVVVVSCRRSGTRSARPPG